jgi:Predicted acyltransferase
MKDFPDFMKAEANHIDTAQQNTKDIDGYFYTANNGYQMAFWTCYEDRVSEEHCHDFDEYMVCLSGRYWATINGVETILSPGDELLIPKGSVQSGRCIAGTRTIHAFGGQRIKQVTGIIIEKIDAANQEKALAMVLSVFMQYEAPDYSEQGIQTFTDFINNKESIDCLEMYGAFKNVELVGVIATKNEGNHIALFFVDSKYHRQGIGRKLFENVIRSSTGGKITVNSSPYAVEVYTKLGFVPDSEEKLTEGMRYTPMTYTFNPGAI